jgi:hypothetical protein
LRFTKDEIEHSHRRRDQFSPSVEHGQPPQEAEARAARHGGAASYPLAPSFSLPVCLALA